jgi:hypothetical protein
MHSQTTRGNVQNLKSSDVRSETERRHSAVQKRYLEVGAVLQTLGKNTEMS